MPLRSAATILPALACAMLLSSCIASTAASLVTAPVRMVGHGVSKGVDLATTSQSEADEKRGRAMREQEGRLGRLDREYQRERQRCIDAGGEACARTRELYGEMEDLRARMYRN